MVCVVLVSCGLLCEKWLVVRFVSVIVVYWVVVI